MKQVMFFVLALFFSLSPLRANDIASGISEFIYGFLYLNIGTTSCQEIINRSGEKGADGFSAQINQLIDAADSLAGRKTVNKDVLNEYSQRLYNYCKQNPGQLFVKALASVSRPLFSDARQELDRNVASLPNTKQRSAVQPLTNENYMHNNVRSSTDTRANNNGIDFIG